ncbi:MAG: type II toxin-antitoxin system HicB family antitoxin [Fusobacteriaceae bacterium]
MKNNYIFPAVFNKAEDGYSVSFPDLPGAFTCGYTLEEALYMAKDCLELFLDDLEAIPILQDITSLKLDSNEQIVMIQADMIEFRKKYNNQKIKKTLSIPKWLNDLGIEKHINFSELLTQALEKKLKIS